MRWQRRTRPGPGRGSDVAPARTGGAPRLPGGLRGGVQGTRVDPGIDDRVAWYLRSGGRVDVDLVASADQAARKVGHEGLRASALRLADGCYERGNDRDLHP